MKFLLTGGAGFIGSHLAETLVSRGHKVVIYDNLSSGKFENVAHIDNSDLFLGTDCRDYYQLLKASHGCQFVYHMASTVGVKRVLADPQECIENIIESTRNVLKLNIPGIYFSTSEVYGKNNDVLSEESDIVLSAKTRWSYAGAKLIGEWLSRSAGWRVVRLFNVVGPRQSGAYGAVFPKFIEQAKHGAPITVYGDGSQIRTFLDVADCVAILDHVRDMDFEITNIGSNNWMSIERLAETVRQTLDSPSTIIKIPYTRAYEGEFEECPARVPSLIKLRSLVGDVRFRSIKQTIEEVANGKFQRHERHEQRSQPAVP